MAVLLTTGSDHVIDHACSSYAESLLGSDAGGQSLSVALTKAGAQAFELLQLCDQVYQSGIAATILCRIVRQDADREYNVDCAARTNDQGAVTGLLIIAKQTTEKIYRETLIQQTKAFELALAGASAPEVLQVLVEVLHRHVGPSARTSILTLDHQTKTLRHGAASGLSEKYVRAIDGIPIGPDIGSCGAAAFLNTEIVSNDLMTDPNWASFKPLAFEEGLASCWSWPIRSSGGQVLGTVAVYNGQPGQLHPDFRQLIDLANRTSAIVLEREAAIALRESVESALRRSEEQLRMAVAVSKIGFYDWDIPNNRVVFSEQMLSDWGLNTDDPDSKPNKLEDALNFIYPEDLSTVRKLIKESVESRKPYFTEYRVIRPADSKVIWVEVRGEVHYDDEGAPVRFFGTSVDITARKRNEEVLRQSEEQFRLFAEVAPQMPFIADADGNITYFNRRWFEYIGESGDATMGWNWTKKGIHHPDDLERTIRTWSHSLRTGEPYQIEYRLRRADGQYRWHLARAVPIRNESGDIERWFGANIDIHDQRELTDQLAAANDVAKKYATELQAAKEAAERANAIKSAFLANMSHEIRTPLGAMLGFADLLKSESNSAEEKLRFVDTIRRNGRALITIVDDILDLSKVEAGRLTIETVNFSPYLLIRDVIGLFSARARNKKVTLNFDFPAAKKDLHVSSDPTRLRQILVNLIGNAVKFTEQGSVSVSVAFSSDNRLLVEVKDSGIGIEPENQTKLFQPFSQADDSMTRKFGGSGLGLALSRKLANALGGDIELASSTPGRGTTFKIAIPFVPGKSTEEQEQNHLSILESERRPLRGLNILVAEDSDDNQVLMRVLLTRCGADVTIVDNGKAAITSALEGDYDVVLMDIQMPGVDGLEATKILRGKGFVKPIIALTAHAMKEERIKTLAAGCDDHLAKPLDLLQLLCALEKILPSHAFMQSEIARPKGLA